MKLAELLLQKIQKKCITIQNNMSKNKFNFMKRIIPRIAFQLLLIIGQVLLIMHIWVLLAII